MHPGTVVWDAGVPSSVLAAVTVLTPCGGDFEFVIYKNKHVIVTEEILKLSALWCGKPYCGVVGRLFACLPIRTVVFFLTALCEPADM